MHVHGLGYVFKYKMYMHCNVIDIVGFPLHYLAETLLCDGQYYLMLCPGL